jgi:hypothetical protein
VVSLRLQRRIGGSMTRRLALPLALLVILATGCNTGHRGVSWDEDDSSPEVAQVRLPLPVRLGVRTHFDQHSGLHRVVLDALRRSPNFEVIQQAFRKGRKGRLDYVVELSYKVETGAKLYNFLTCFPGFVVLAPWWAQLRWDFDITTRIRLVRPGDSPVADLSRRDAFDLAFTDSTYSLACNIGFVGILFWPAASSPLGTGVVSAFYNGQPWAYRVRLYRSLAAQVWGDRLSNTIASRVEADLATRSSREQGESPAGTK